MRHHHPEPPNKVRLVVDMGGVGGESLVVRALFGMARTSDAACLSAGSSVARFAPVATIAPLAATYYRSSSDVGGKLTVTLDVTGFEARLSLVDAEGLPLVQSDGAGTRRRRRGLIDVNVPAGDDFLEVQSLSGRGAYQITADFTPTSPAFQTIPTLSPVRIRSPPATSSVRVSPCRPRRP